MSGTPCPIRFATDLITEGMRPTRIVRIRPSTWPDVHLPREEHLDGGSSTLEDRFPTPAIFPHTDPDGVLV